MINITGNLNLLNIIINRSNYLQMIIIGREDLDFIE